MLKLLQIGQFTAKNKCVWLITQIRREMCCYIIKPHADYSPKCIGHWVRSESLKNGETQ